MNPESTFELELPDGRIRYFGGDETVDRTRWIAYIESITRSVQTKGQETDLARADGAIAGPRYRGAQSLAIDLFFYRDQGFTPAQRAIDIERYQIIYDQLLRGDGVLRWDDDTGIRKEIRGLRVANSLDIRQGDGMMKLSQLQLISGDPLIHGADAHTLELQDTSGYLSGFNWGSATAWPIYTITGPCDNFWIKNTDTDEEIVFSEAVSAGESVTIDPLKREADWSDGTDAYSGLDREASSFFGLTPDDETIIQFGSTNGDTNTKISMRWSAAWS